MEEGGGELMTRQDLFGRETHSRTSGGSIGDGGGATMARQRRNSSRNHKHLLFRGKVPFRMLISPEIF